MMIVDQQEDFFRFNDSLVQYGDGLFETMLAVDHRIHHWSYHWERLSHSCQRLGISVPERGLLEKHCQTTLSAQQNRYSVVKMIIARGEGLRGYRSLPEQPPQVRLSVSPFQLDRSRYRGLHLRICQTRLASQPLLAGMKHCNRIEYVMARRESMDGHFDEGLLLDYDNHVIEGLISNVFIINGKVIKTPDLHNAGVAGTLRAYLLKKLPQMGYTIILDKLTIDDITRADEVFMTNAVHGVMPVYTVDGVEKFFSMAVAQQIRQQTEHPCSA